MNKRLLTAGCVTAGICMLALGMSLRLTASLAPGDLALGTPCEWDPVLFPLPTRDSRQTRSVSEIWSDTYHGTVSAVIEAHLGPAGTSLSCQELPERMASPPLSTLAAKLQPWSSTPSALAALKESDMGAVLLEHLRVYQCSMRQRWLPLGSTIYEEMGTAEALGINLIELLDRIEREQQFLQTEPTLAGKALTRTLAALSGRERLEPLSGSMECLARASVDLSNELGLGASVSACLPARAWDTKGSLLSLPQP